MTKQKSNIWKFVLAVCVIGSAAVLFGRNVWESIGEKESLAGKNKSFEKCTWEEYQAMSLEEQDAFYQKFESAEDFTVWMEAKKPDEEPIPDLNWKNHKKQPDTYTWEEYQGLSQEDQDAFFHWFASKEEFEAWKEAAKPVENIEVIKWDDSQKQPGEYTWEEYQVLNANEQEAFYQWFESLEDFEKWMKAVKPDENQTPDLNWNKPGKQPNEYTWNEFQKLSLEEQDAFFLWFETVEDFEEWREINEPKQYS